MGCPICGGMLELGTLRTSGGPGLFFLPQGEEELPGLLRVSQKMLEKRGGLVLDGPYLIRFSQTKLPVKLCRSCRKIILDY